MEGGAVGHNFERDPPKDHPFRQCGIFLLDFGTVPTVLCFSFLFIIDCSLEALTFLLFIKMICICTFYYLLKIYSVQKKNTTLLEQFQNSIEKYNTVGTVPKSNRKIQHCWNSSKIQ
jgi:hypothetical protein